MRSKHARRLSRVHKKALWIATGAFFVIMLLTFFSSAQKPFASSEVQFTDLSKSGLSVVPASCDSNPPYEHSAGECDVAVSSNCTLSATSAYISPGGTTSLQWHVTQPAVAAFFPASFSGNISPGVGSISSFDGSTIVSPSITTTYLLSGTISVNLPWFGSARTGSAQCQATVGVGTDGGGGSCDAPHQVINGICSCPAGTLSYNNTCVSQCPSGVIQFNNSCVTQCPVGYTQSGTSCIFHSCPAGYQQQGNLCVQSCSVGYYCSGTNLYYRNSSCQASLAQACTYGCSAGACISPPQPGVSLWQVRPTLVRSGDRVNVNWSASNVRSCSVSGSNGDHWSGPSGAQISSPIIAQTVFTLSCVGTDDSALVQSTTVNVIPEFQEI